MEHTKIIRDIPLKFNKAELAQKLCLKIEMPEYSEFIELLDRALGIAAPKTIYARVAILSRSESEIKIVGTSFNSPLLAEKLSESEAVFPYIMTCGKELDSLKNSSDDPLRLYWIEFIKEDVLRQTAEVLQNEMLNVIGGKFVKWLEPTDPAFWPVSDLKQVFAAFSEKSLAELGVELTEYMFIIPNKSRAGVYFASKDDFLICDHCSMKANCGNCTGSLD
jgi:hypothetical protein